MHAIGIDLGGTNIAAGVVNSNGVIIAKDSIPTKSERHYSEIIADMAFLAKKIWEQTGLPDNELAGTGIGAPGLVNSGGGIITYLSSIKFKNVPLVDEFLKHVKGPVFISNDANCAALGECSDAGAAKGLKDVILITLGTGVGGGIIIDGKIYEGMHGAGAELGHTILVVDGVLCTCGRKGCWESYSSATALIHQTINAIMQDRNTIMWDLIEGNTDKVNGRTAFDAARKGDRIACDVVGNYIKYLSEGLIDMVNIFRPQAILIGGGICNEGDFLLDPVRKYVRQYAYGAEMAPIPKIMKCNLGNDAGIIGAAMLVLRNKTA